MILHTPAVDREYGLASLVLQTPFSFLSGCRNGEAGIKTGPSSGLVNGLSSAISVSPLHQSVIA